MDETNRAGAIIVALMLIFVALLVVLLAWSAPDQSIDSIADLAGYLQDHNDAPTQLLVTFGALIVALLGVTVIILELMPEQSGSVKVAKVGSGDARIGTDEITQQLETELRSVPRLRNVEARVSSRGSRADVKLDLLVDNEADVTETANAAMLRTREIVEQRMGIELDTPPRAEVHFSDDSKPSRPAAPVNTPSWRPAATPPNQPSTSNEATSNESVHEATPSVSEDRPAGA